MRSLLTCLAALGGLTSPATAQAWWDSAYSDRQIIEITTGANTPDKGYDGYTVRLTGVDTASLISAGDLRADCNDLRVIYWDGTSNTELPRHVINCNAASTDIRFMMSANQAASTTSQDYYLYSGNASAGAPTALTTTNVYLWYDDATANRIADYTYGRFDAWHGGGFDNSLAYNGAGFYTINTGDNFTSGARRAVDERDVYIEIETFHTGCYPLNMTTGPVTRGIVTGAGGSESSAHYYGATRAEFPTGCNAGGYATDGDIVEAARTTVSVDGANPGPVIANQWRRFALASWRVNPTFLSYYDEQATASWDALGYPSGANLHVTGSDANDFEGRGEAGIVFAQDNLRWRGMLIRRYTEPEPVLTLAPPPGMGELEAEKSTAVYDPLGQGLYAIPGNDVIYTITVRNVGDGPTDAGTILLIDKLPDELEFYNGDIDDAGPESDPVSFSQSAGAGLTFTYGDDVRYSNSAVRPSDFTSCGYGPSLGYDDAVTYLCINPQGALANGTPDPEFSVSFRARIK